MGEVTRKVKGLPLIISINGDQFKENENIPEQLIINNESNLYMLVLVAMFLKFLDYFISIFWFNSSPWFSYDGLASRKTKIIKRPAHNGKLGVLVFISKQMASKVSHPAKAFGTGISSMDIDSNFRLRERRFRDTRVWKPEEAGKGEKDVSNQVWFTTWRRS